MISQPIAFGLVVPNVTPKIMCARAHPKSMMSKYFPSLDIIWEYNQYALGRIEGDILVPGCGTLANQNRSQVS